MITLTLGAKFAKKVEVRDNSCILNRMFHLLTSQVMFREDCTDFRCSPETLKDIRSIHPKDLLGMHFKVETCNVQWNSFSRNVFPSIAENCESLIVSLRKRMPPIKQITL